MIITSENKLQFCPSGATIFLQPSEQLGRYTDYTGTKFSRDRMWQQQWANSEPKTLQTRQTLESDLRMRNRASRVAYPEQLHIESNELVESGFRIRPMAMNDADENVFISQLWCKNI